MSRKAKKKSIVDLRPLWTAFVRVSVSLLCAGITYSFWLAAFLLTGRLESPVVEIAGWLSALVVTAAGFAVGIAIGERLTKVRKTRFLRIFVWPLVGCMLGAAVVYWFGPMLIVFGMFVVGTASIAFREMILWPRGRD